MIVQKMSSSDSPGGSGHRMDLGLRLQDLPPCCLECIPAEKYRPPRLHQRLGMTISCVGTSERDASFSRKKVK